MKSIDSSRIMRRTKVSSLSLFDDNVFIKHPGLKWVCGYDYKSYADNSFAICCRRLQRYRLSIIYAAL